MQRRPYIYHDVDCKTLAIKTAAHRVPTLEVSCELNDQPPRQDRRTRTADKVARGSAKSLKNKEACTGITRRLARKGSRQQPGPSGRAWYSSIPPSSTIVAAPLPLILTQSQAEYSSARAFHPSRERGRGGLDTYRSISHRICSGPMRRRKGRLLGLGVGPKALRSQGAPTAKQQQIMRHDVGTVSILFGVAQDI